MTVMAMMQILVRMSLQGSIIIGIVFFHLIFPWKIWQYADTAQGTLYWFTVSQGKITVITEEQLTA